MKKNISLIDIGAGNLHSVYKAFKYIGANIEITNNPNTIENSPVIIFPGVGAFGAVVDQIKKNNLEQAITKAINAKKPFLGICLGMQVLFESAEESPDTKGLGVFKGKVIKFKKANKVPHVGWNEISSQPPLASLALGGWSVVSSQKFYFVHSYYVVPEDKSIIAGETEYDGEKFVSAIKKDNLFAVQFHPEKSGEAGLELLRWFIKM